MLTGGILERMRNFTLAEEGRRMGLYLFFREIVSELDTEVTLAGGKRVLMLGSNSYMGLTTNPEVKEAAKRAIEKYGTGCSGSRFLNGTFDIHLQLEAALAEWVGKEAVLLFSTGFQVNQGVIAAVLNRHDHVLMDMCDHASIVDGARLSTAKVVRYRHNDLEELESLLLEIPAHKGKFIVVDGIFSMEGDLARLPQVALLAGKHHSALMVDDAHGFGVMGKEGSGSVAHFGLTGEVDFIMGTFSKSLASLGGFIAADKVSIEYLKHQSRAFMFSASMPPSSAAAALAALRIIRREPERIEKLWDNARFLREGLQSLGYDTGSSETPIIPVYIGDPITLMRTCKRLEEEGIFVNPVLPPAVQPNRALLRLSLMATHSKSQIAFALDKFEKIGREMDLI
ncbi:MAG: pyridoxal phosphate-dependent aminotransferase family protein [Desulfobacteraceae bacterium]|nr:MAG: pyridoxal phosphate-dependent aminotransferase family protein [Desulfobacteraceae bacterium]